VDKFKKNLVQSKCEQKSEASEATEYRIYDVTDDFKSVQERGKRGFYSAQTWAIDSVSREGQRDSEGRVVG
jgi:hypothetical protein